MSTTSVLNEFRPYSGAPVTPGPLPHDTRLEPADETVAELQAFVVQSRQTGELDLAQTIACLCHCTRRIIESHDPAYAVALAAFALRLREEHLL